MAKFNETGDARKLLSIKSSERLCELASAPLDADLTFSRTSKWVIKIRVCVGLCQYACFKFNCRTGEYSRA